MPGAWAACSAREELAAEVAAITRAGTEALIAEGGNLLSPEQESGKLKLAADVARATWGE